MPAKQMSTQLRDLIDEWDAKKDRLHSILEEAKGEDGAHDFDRITSLEGDASAKAEKIAALNEELNDIYERIEKQRKADDAIEDAQNRQAEKLRVPPHPDEGEGEKKLSDLFLESDAYKALFTGDSRNAVKQGPSSRLDVETKTVMSTGAGWDPEDIRMPGFVPDAQRPVQVLDLIPTSGTNQSTVVWMEETTFTNNAAEVSESVEGTPGTFGEAALAYTQQTSEVRKIAVWIPVTDEQLEDVPQLRGIIDGRLRFMLRQRLDLQVLVGDGVAPNLEGVNNVTGILTQALGTDTEIDAAYRAVRQVRVTGRAAPTAFVFHPNDWETIRLSTDANGQYLFGPPSQAGIERLWGIPVTQSDAQTENTGLVGDFATYSELHPRRGIDIQVSDSHSTFFIEGTQAIRADMRIAFRVTRPEAFAQITGI